MTIEPAQIERQCMKLASAVELGESDEVVLLRTARSLKRIYPDLVRAVTTSPRLQGGTQVEAALVHRSLTALEQDLRQVLLGHPFLPRQQMQTYLADAVRQTLLALDLLAV